MSEGMQAELVRALPGAILGLFPIALTAFFDWQEKRDVLEKRNQAIDFAHRRVAFLTDWVKAHESCTTERLSYIRQDVSSELNQLKQDLEKTLALQERRKAIKSAMRDKRSLMQHLFLAYIPRSTFAWVLHILYYMMSGIFCLALLVSLLGGGYASDPNNWNWSDFYIFNFVVVVIFVPPMVLIHWSARMADRHSRQFRDEM